jgi:hypothetical protein
MNSFTEIHAPQDAEQTMLSFQAWKETAEGKKAAAEADKMTREEKIADIMRILMTLAGEPEEAIRDQMQKCMKGGAENE